MFKYRIGFGLYLLAAIIVVVTYNLEASWPWKAGWYTMALIVAVVASLINANSFLEWLDKRFKGSELYADIEDDIDDLKNLRPTMTMAISLASVASLFAAVWLFGHYHKFTAHWGGFNVVLLGILGIGIVVFVSLMTDWFHDKEFRTPAWVFGVVIGGLILSAGLGVYMTEPLETGGPTAYQAATGTTGEQAQQNDDYDYSRTRAGGIYIYNFGGGSSSSGSVSSPDINCSGKGCGYALLVVLLIVLVLILIIASAMVPHFWVFASMVLVAIMVMIAIHEIRVRSYAPYRRTTYSVR